MHGVGVLNFIDQEGSPPLVIVGPYLFVLQGPKRVHLQVGVVKHAGTPLGRRDELPHEPEGVVQLREGFNEPFIGRA